METILKRGIDGLVGADAGLVWFSVHKKLELHKDVVAKLLRESTSAQNF